MGKVFEKWFNDEVLDDIHAMLLKGATDSDICKKYKISESMFFFFRNNQYPYKNQNGEWCRPFDDDEYKRFKEAVDVEKERIIRVEQSLYRACFDRTVKHLDVNRKTGELVEVESVIPASYYAQRYFLINKSKQGKTTEKWINENTPDTSSTGLLDLPVIKVSFENQDTKENQDRINELNNLIDSELKK